MLRKLTGWLLKLGEVEGLIDTQFLMKNVCNPFHLLFQFFDAHYIFIRKWCNMGGAVSTWTPLDGRYRNKSN